ncbi:hypothetical protein GDO86_002542 [Hymenochirus boettgeri]|uniref:Alpha-protein kinase 2 n=1 Tax=Hymenochirus boettgeri TaxID=247094 RepID=A0A8T2KLA6_9PIPI|nr:hypothetical protein GDO86_002542 [Hymenochirus boettgeri]
MIDYTNGICQVQLDTDHEFLLESDQVEETKLSQDYLNGCDSVLSGGTCVNKVSNITVDAHAFTGFCVSPSEPTQIDAKRGLYGDHLGALEPDMVIKLAHQRDENSIVKSKERSNLPFSAAAIQNDQAGIEEENKENRLQGEISTHSKQIPGDTLDLFSGNGIDNIVSITSMDPQTGKTTEPTANYSDPYKEDKLKDKTIELLGIDSLGKSLVVSKEEESTQMALSLNSSERVTSQSEQRNTRPVCEKTREAKMECLNVPKEQPGKYKECWENCCQRNVSNQKSQDEEKSDYAQSGNNRKTTEFCPETCKQGTYNILEKVNVNNKIKKVDGVNTNNSGSDHSAVPKTLCERPVLPVDRPLDGTGQHYTETLDKKESIGESISATKCPTEICKDCKKTEKIHHLLRAVNDKDFIHIKRQKEPGGKGVLVHTRGEGMVAQTRGEGVVAQTRGEGMVAQTRESVSNENNTHIDKRTHGEHLELSTNVCYGDKTFSRTINSTSCNSNKTEGSWGKKQPNQNQGLCDINKGTKDFQENCSRTSACNWKKLNGEMSLDKPRSDISNTTLTKCSAQKAKVKLQSVSSNVAHVESEEDDNVNHFPEPQELLFICEDSDTHHDELTAKGVCGQKPKSKTPLTPRTKSSSSGPSIACKKKTEDGLSKRTLNTKVMGSDSHSRFHEKLGVEIHENSPETKENEEKVEFSASPGKPNKAPTLLHRVEAEMFPDCSGNLKLFCHFGDIHADSTVTWTKDSKLLARLHRSSNDDSPVSLAIVQMSRKDQGVYLCSLKNLYGKVTTEFHLTSEGGEEIEFNQLLFREDFITDMYFGGNLHGRIATEDFHFGEGVHRKAFRSKVMCGLFPVFNPGHLCVLKVHNAIAYGTKTNDELVQRNYKLAVQECYVQNTAREYAKIYAAEAEQLEEFGTVPEIIPIFLVHRPASNIPYATVEEELIGEFVKYSVKDGKEINFLRKDSEAGQKCCTFQHWVYEKTNGNLLVTDMQGVGMKLTDVGIATLSKGYKGFKGNCSVSFIEQFKALHQCNKYCEILGLKSLRANPQKQKKPSGPKERTQPSAPTSRKSKTGPKTKHKT